MLRQTCRFALALVFGLALFASGAQASDWKQLVNQAGGYWAKDLNAAGWSKVIASNSEQVMGQLPKGVRTMLRSEIKDNPWITGHEEMTTKLGRFRPEAQQVFDLPHIPIPADKMKHSYESRGMSARMRENVSYTDPRSGQKMVRFFFHPLYADKYKELIETYGVKYDYQATPTSSPRSLIVWRKGEPQKPIWVKVSLHATIDSYTKRDKSGQEKKVGISRVQSEKKAKRSALVNAAFGGAKADELQRHRLSYMAEPASFVPADITYKGARRGFDRSTIFRDLPEALTNDNAQTTYVPAFTFIKNMKSTLATVNAERSAVGKKPVNAIGWMTKGLIEPLVRSYLYLGLEHGLQGELHTQNFLLEVDKKGVPTGRMMVKDLDGFRMDLDMRVRNGRSLKYLDHFNHPFEWAKHSATQGSSSNPAVLQGWFNKLIRNVNGFTTTRTVNGVTQTVYSTPAGQLMERLEQDFPEVMAQLKRQAARRDPSLKGNDVKLKQKAVEQVFDLVGRAQLNRITGIRVDMKDWGYGQNKGLNKGLKELRDQLATSQEGLGARYNPQAKKFEATSPQAQTVLAGTWNRLRTTAERKADDRTFVRGTPQVYRLLGNGVIEGISRSGKSVGYAILKPKDIEKLGVDLQAAGLRLPEARTRAPGKLADYSQRRELRAPMSPWLKGSEGRSGSGPASVNAAGQGSSGSGRRGLLGRINLFRR